MKLFYGLLLLYLCLAHGASSQWFGIGDDGDTVTTKQPSTTAPASTSTSTASINVLNRYAIHVHIAYQFPADPPVKITTKKPDRRKKQSKHPQTTEESMYLVSNRVGTMEGILESTC